MPASQNRPRKSKHRKGYPIDQCALYKVGSKKRLAQILEVDQKDLLRLSFDNGNFQVFTLDEKVCEFTGDKKKARLVQNPIQDLKDIQSRITKLLSRIESPAYCHGAKSGCSYRSNAKTHIDAQAVAVFDLEKFFPSTTSRQVFSFFQEDLLCAPDIAGLLTDLCTYGGALPTGAPSSPILAYWANRRLFETLEDRAKTLGLNFSVYIDDITFSGNSIPQSLSDQVDGIVKKHGHKLSENKTKIYGHNTIKHVTGVVIHEGTLRVPYKRFRKLRKMQQAFEATTNVELRALLAAKICGLLGEAAFLDSRFQSMAKDSIEQMKVAQSKLPRRTKPSKIKLKSFYQDTDISNDDTIPF